MGTLRGFDDYVNMVLDDVTEYAFIPGSDGLQKSKKQLDQVLLNGNNICLVRARSILYSEHLIVGAGWISTVELVANGVDKYRIIYLIINVCAILDILV